MNRQPTSKQLMEAIHRGALWLDETLMQWWNKIDLPKLTIKSDHMCIVGQLFGSFLIFRERLSPFKFYNDEIKCSWCASNGFALQFDLSPDKSVETVSFWQRCWTVQVLNRRLFAFHVYPYTGGFRISVRTLASKTGWVDLGVVADESELVERYTNLRDYLTGTSYKRMFGG